MNFFSKFKEEFIKKDVLFLYVNKGFMEVDYFEDEMMKFDILDENLNIVKDWIDVLG